jgi:hypothetical protein
VKVFQTAFGSGHQGTLSLDVSIGVSSECGVLKSNIELLDFNSHELIKMQA